MISYRLFSVLAGCLLFSHVVPAISGQENTISVSGTSGVRRLPETIRLAVTVQARGKTVEEALSKLQSERDSTLEKIVSLGFDKERVTADDFGIDQQEENKRRQMQMMIAQRMNQGRRKKKASAREPVLVRCQLLAEHPISGTTAEAVLREGCEWAQKVKAANLSPETTAQTPEEAELIEEMHGMNFHSGEPGSGNEPRLIYISNVSEEEARKAYAEAFQHARKQGEILAAAAGVKAGALTRLSAHLAKNPSGANNPYGNYNPHFSVRQMTGSPQSDFDGLKQLEGSATTPEAMTFAFTVDAVFTIEK